MHKGSLCLSSKDSSWVCRVVSYVRVTSYTGSVLQAGFDLQNKPEPLLPPGTWDLMHHELPVTERCSQAPKPSV